MPTLKVMLFLYQSVKMLNV